MAKTIFEKGIDVSKYQGVIDWNKVKADGYKFAIIRCVSTNTSGLYVDPYFEINYQNAKAVGLKVGAYYYTYAVDKAYADKELDLVLKCLSGKQFEYPILVDVEDKSTAAMGKTSGTSMLKYQLDTLEKAGYYACIYTYYAYQQSYLDMSQLQSYDLAIACYTSSCYYTGAYGIWQYSSKGSVAGVNGNCDMDYSYKDYATIIKNAGLNGFKKATNDDTPKDDTDKSETEKLQDEVTSLESENAILKEKIEKAKVVLS